MSMKGLFKEATDYFRLTQEGVQDSSEVDTIKEYRLEAMPDIRFRFELYEEEGYIKFLMIPDGYGWRTIHNFDIEADHWSPEHINMAVAGAMKAIREMYRIYGSR